MIIDKINKAVSKDIYGTKGKYKVKSTELRKGDIATIDYGTFNLGSQRINEQPAISRMYYPFYKVTNEYFVDGQNATTQPVAFAKLENGFLKKVSNFDNGQGSYSDENSKGTSPITTKDGFIIYRTYSPSNRVVLSKIMNDTFSIVDFYETDGFPMDILKLSDTEFLVALRQNKPGKEVLLKTSVEYFKIENNKLILKQDILINEERLVFSIKYNLHDRFKMALFGKKIVCGLILGISPSQTTVQYLKTSKQEAYSFYLEKEQDQFVKKDFKKIYSSERNNYNISSGSTPYEHYVICRVKDFQARTEFTIEFLLTENGVKTKITNVTGWDVDKNYIGNGFKVNNMYFDYNNKCIFRVLGNKLITLASNVSLSGASLGYFLDDTTIRILYKEYVNGGGYREWYQDVKISKPLELIPYNGTNPCIVLENGKQGKLVEVVEPL